MVIGSTGVACRNTNRNFIGFELDEVLHFKTIKIYLDKYKKICYYQVY